MSPARASAFNSRRSFYALAVVLALILAALLGYLVWYLQPPTSSPKGKVVAGLRPEIVLNGPGIGTKPDFDRPLGACWGKDGRIYVSDSGNNRIVVFAKDGTFIREFGGFGVAKPAPGGAASWGPGALNFPAGIDADSAGNIYVADFYNDSISVFDPNGKFLRRFPEPDQPVGKGGSGKNGDGIAVTDVEVVGDKVYATDTWQVVEFTTDGTFVRQFGMPGTGPNGLDHPNGIAASRSGTVYVADSNNNRVSAFDPKGRPLWRLGSPIYDLTKTVKRPLNIPRDVTVLPDGKVLVVDALDQSLVLVSRDGKESARYGARGTDPGALNFPNSIDERAGRLLVADKENNRVQVLTIAGAK